MWAVRDKPKPARVGVGLAVGGDARVACALRVFSEGMEEAMRSSLPRVSLASQHACKKTIRDLVVANAAIYWWRGRRFIGG